ncbi:SSI family serine proteinase inhibitor [Streptomyces sp. GXMU-J15]|uniref:SSI family serine proteinase inhibitor n=1 Tax=Streptomyces fuscus TaxID=3048495 RepID=A0ABT7JAF2_9ACTN|nr:MULTISPECIES: SSI family serine proteinase inhibitor [Streptomyces]MDL2081858.1 SSI family serine proteinase inhibitor [Streptomyces fuscus]SBT90915.1 Subtilisin inhibitor-like [Streptomyces sp. DI166]
MTHSTTVRAGRAGALLASAALLTLATAPVRAAEPADLPGNWLRLSLTTGDSASSDTRGTLLMCDPPQGHRHAAEACGQLASVKGDIAAMRPLNAVCPMIYAPVTARATGQWDGRAVSYEHTFANTCQLQATTGSVFALDSDQLDETDETLPGLAD